MQSVEIKSEARRFAMQSMLHRPNPYPVDKIVYLDDDQFSYKYFLTGQFDEEGRMKVLQAQQNDQKRSLDPAE